VLAVVVLLREVLLPFVAGMVGIAVVAFQCSGKQRLCWKALAADAGGKPQRCGGHWSGAFCAGTIAFPIGHSASPASFRCAQANGMPTFALHLGTLLPLFLGWQMTVAAIIGYCIVPRSGDDKLAPL
jgi:hypothetical protein